MTELMIAVEIFCVAKTIADPNFTQMQIAVQRRKVSLSKYYGQHMIIHIIIMTHPQIQCIKLQILMVPAMVDRNLIWKHAAIKEVPVELVKDIAHLIFIVVEDLFVATTTVVLNLLGVMRIAVKRMTVGYLNVFLGCFFYFHQYARMVRIFD